jgi:hypothetical protein
MVSNSIEGRRWRWQDATSLPNDCMSKLRMLNEQINQIGLNTMKKHSQQGNIKTEKTDEAKGAVIRLA